MYSKLDNNFSLQFKHHLNKDNLSDLPTILNEHKCVIAGSYVLQSLCDASWANDIDIWCVNPDIDNLLKNIINLGYTITGFREMNTRDALKKQKLMTIENILDDKEGLLTSDYKKKLLQIKNIIQEERIPDEIVQGIDDYRRLQKCVKSVYYLKSQTKPLIQLIICNENILDCINSFDFNVCQTYYDGENIFVKDKDTFMMCLKEKRAVITREASEMQSRIEWIRTLKRAIKYTERGFFIDFSIAKKYIKKIAQNDIQFARLWNVTLLNNKSEFIYTRKKYRKLLHQLSVLLLKTPKLPHFYLYDKNDKRIIFGYVRDESELFYIPYSERLNIPLMFQFGSDDEIHL